MNDALLRRIRLKYKMQVCQMLQRMEQANQSTQETRSYLKAYLLIL